MSPVHATITRRHALRALGCAAVALLAVTPTGGRRLVRLRFDQRSFSLVMEPLRAGDVFEIRGTYLVNPRP